MFERYTEKARRVIFFARYEASQFGSPCIETEHLRAGLDLFANRFGTRGAKESMGERLILPQKAQQPRKADGSTTST
jgi:hypothetical protein